MRMGKDFKIFFMLRTWCSPPTHPVFFALSSFCINVVFGALLGWARQNLHFTHKLARLQATRLPPRLTFHHHPGIHQRQCTAKLDCLINKASRTSFIESMSSYLCTVAQTGVRIGLVTSTQVTCPIKVAYCLSCGFLWLIIFDHD